MRTMYDGIADDAHLIPADAQMVAGYVDGLYRWSDTHWALFPHAIKVRIAVFATTDDGVVLDCEKGNCTPAESVDWTLMRRKAGVDPTVYCGRNTWWADIQAAHRARGVPQPHYWVADYSVDQTNPAIPAGAIALQYADKGSYDLSVVADHWPGVDPNLEADMALTAADGDMIAQRIENRHVGEIPATPDKQETTLGIETASNPARWAGVNAKLDGLTAKVAKLAVPTVDPAAVKAALQDPATLKLLARALAVELHNDTPAA